MTTPIGEATVRIEADDRDLQATVAKDRFLLKEAFGKVQTIKVDTADARYQMARLTADALRAQRQLDKASEDSVRRAELGILRLLAAQERAAKRFGTSSTGDARGGLIARLIGSLGGGGGSGSGALGGLGRIKLPGFLGGANIGSAIRTILSLGGGGGITGVGPLGGGAAIFGGPLALWGIAQGISNVFAAVGTGITFALGGAITALGVMSAVKIPAVAKAFAALSKQASTDLTSISQAFVKPLQDIALMGQAQLPGVMLALGDAMRSIAGPFDKFATTLVKSLGDASVQNTIRTLGVAMGNLLKAFTPAIPPIVDSIAQGIRGMAEAVAAHPGIFVNFVKVLGEMVGGTFAFLGAMVRTANWMNTTAGDAVRGFNIMWVQPLVKFFTKIVPTALDIFRLWVKLEFTEVAIDAIKLVKTIVTVFALLPGPMGKPFKIAKTAIDQTLAGMEKSAHRTVDAIQADFNRLHSKTVDLLVAGSGTWKALSAAGQFAGGSFTAQATHHAAGGLIGGGTAGRDSVLGLLMPGEVVVPAHMVRGGAVDHLRGRLPGFASGGIVPNYHGTVGGLWPWMSHNVAATESQIVATIGSQWARQWKQVMASMAVGSPGFGIAASGPLQSYARALLAAYGWANQWAAFNDIVMRESGWNPLISNPSSGAYGIPQALPASKMASAGADWRTNGFTQLRWMMGYIRQRWGNPANADFNEITQHWYDGGGWLPPGRSLVYNGTGRAERVIPPGKEACHHVLEIKASNGGAASYNQFLVNEIRKAVQRVGGGDVQCTFGSP